MTNDQPGKRGAAGRRAARPDSERALQKELRREGQEGADSVGDTSSNRNLTGSSSWDTQTDPPDVGATTGRADQGAARGEADGEGSGGERGRAADEIAARLRRRGVRLFGQESGEELADLLDAVERFETVIERSGGDLMMDEPVAGADAPTAPDDRAFVLPVRQPNQTVAAYIGEIDEAATRASRGDARG